MLGTVHVNSLGKAELRCRKKKKNSGVKGEEKGEPRKNSRSDPPVFLSVDVLHVTVCVLVYHTELSAATVSDTR